MPEYTPITDIDEIRTDRHGLIEASAGTGKTYTIQNLVRRFLVEREDLRIDNILLVTFTEKAASELKIKIRGQLEADLAQNRIPAHRRAHVQAALNEFDTAAVFTIHGFCHRLLNDFAFENRSHFQLEVVDDRPLFESRLREHMRAKWPARYGEDLGDLLQLGGFVTQKEKQAFIQKVTHIARNVYHPQAGDILEPETRGVELHQYRMEIQGLVAELTSAAESPPGLLAGYARLNINAAAKKAILNKMIAPIEDFVQGRMAGDVRIGPVAKLMQHLAAVSSSGRKGLECLMPEKWLKAGPNPEVCPALPRVAEILFALQDRVFHLSHLLMNQSIETLIADVAALKQARGWIHYDDMLTRVHQAVLAPGGEALRAAVRKRYKVVFVDEFQDTDPIQWRILQHLFLQSPEHRLFLIGDPKQAIYAFRGADVYAYMEARRHLEHLVGQGRAGLYCLARNYRSRPELVEVFNRLFKTPAWFAPRTPEDPLCISYQPVQAALAPGRAPAVCLVDVSGYSSLVRAKPALAAWIAGEIRRLQSLAPQTFRLDECCILVRGRSEAELVEAELTRQGIAFLHYRKPGLFASAEAFYLDLVFQAILNPADRGTFKKCLLTPFFDQDLRVLLTHEDPGPEHVIHQLLRKWRDLAATRRFRRLFNALIEDSGFLFRYGASPGWDRMIANYRQVFEHLENAAFERNLGFSGLAALLAEYRRRAAGPDDADVHQIETEARKVNIMTMHISKGLEFDNVFIAGGLTQKPFGDAYHIYHHLEAPGHQSKVTKHIDLSASLSPEAHLGEKADEDKRLLYVALTRARERLYLPFAPQQADKPFAGPVTRLIPSALADGFENPKTSRHFVWAVPPAAPAAAPASVSDQDEAPPLNLPDPLLPQAPDVGHRRPTMASFSSLHAASSESRPETALPAGFSPEAEKNKSADEFAAPDPQQAAADADRLPGGVEIGSMFHDILEVMDFEKAHAIMTLAPDPGQALAAHGPFLDLIQRKMTLYRIVPRFLPDIARVIAATLQKPLPGPAGEFCLGRLADQDRRHEVEFYYPFETSLPAGEPVPGCSRQNGYIHGYIDLIFRQAGRYYIADWKSNRLDGGYGAEQMQVCMDAADYHLQYLLYTVATLRWLARRMGPGFDPDRQFGGVFYFFLRGMAGPGFDGVYFVSPEALGPFATLEERVMARISPTVRG